MQAVPNMLELVPSSVNKWVALEKALLPDLALSPSEVMAIGDGGNDYEMVKNVGLGVAMGNAVPKVGLLIHLMRMQGHLPPKKDACAPRMQMHACHALGELAPQPMLRSILCRAGDGSCRCQCGQQR